jgi:hypothetical protein
MSYYNNIETNTIKILLIHYYYLVRELNLPHNLWFGRNIIIYPIKLVSCTSDLSRCNKKHVVGLIDRVKDEPPFTMLSSRL